VSPAPRRRSSSSIGGGRCFHPAVGGRHASMATTTGLRGRRRRRRGGGDGGDPPQWRRSGLVTGEAVLRFRVVGASERLRVAVGRRGAGRPLVPGGGGQGVELSRALVGPEGVQDRCTPSACQRPLELWVHRPPPHLPSLTGARSPRQPVCTNALALVR